VSLIGNRRSRLIVREHDLRKGPARYNQLRKSLAPIISKTLSSKLKELDQYGIVAKKIIDFKSTRPSNAH
jgi:DNA-binding HxlR family transcriptional regulator